MLVFLTRKGFMNTEVCSERFRASEIEHFARNINGWKELTVFAKKLCLICSTNFWINPWNRLLICLQRSPFPTLPSLFIIKILNLRLYQFILLQTGCTLELPLPSCSHLNVVKLTSVCCDISYYCSHKVCK